MSKTKHTPGPWTIEEIAPRIIGISNSQLWVAKIPGGMSDVIAQANARLIAACPDAYDLAKLILESNDVLEGPVRQAARDFLRKIQS